MEDERFFKKFFLELFSFTFSLRIHYNSIIRFLHQSLEEARIQNTRENLKVASS